MIEEKQKRKQSVLAVIILTAAVCISAGIILYAVNFAYGGKIYSVKFYDLDNNVIKTERLKGGFVQPPDKAEVGGDDIFLRWDKDILNISDNTDIYPATRNISSGDNVFFINAVYVKSGNTLAAPLMSGGKVKFSSVKITMTYDPVMLEYVEEKTNERNAVIQHSAESSTVTVSLGAAQNITRGGMISELSFNAVGKQFSYTEIVLKVDGIKKIDENGVEAGGDCELYNGKIYIY
jgi:hypothetical protein